MSRKQRIVNLSVLLQNLDDAIAGHERQLIAMRAQRTQVDSELEALTEQQTPEDISLS